jgi:hypothetical protein
MEACKGTQQRPENFNGETQKIASISMQSGEGPTHDHRSTATF